MAPLSPVNACVLTHQLHKPLQKHSLRQFLSLYTCCGFYSVCSLKWIQHSNGKTMSKRRLVCESKAVTYWQERDNLCQTQTLHTGWQQTKSSIGRGGLVSQEKRPEVGPILKVLGPRGMDVQVAHAAAVSQASLQWAPVIWHFLCVFSSTLTLQYLWSGKMLLLRATGCKS